MTKFDPILTDDDIIELLATSEESPIYIIEDGRMFSSLRADGDELSDEALEIARIIERALIAKQAEQKPVMYARTYNGEIDWDEHCVAADSGTLFDCGSYHDENDEIPEGYAVMPLYAHPVLSSSNESDKTVCLPESTESEGQDAELLKRYGLGSVYLCAPRGNAAIKGPGIVECKDGEFYSAAEVDDFLESIGAGGVSGRITSKTLEQHRVEFEQYASDNGKWVEAVARNQDGFYKLQTTYNAWLVWKAARDITE